MFSIYFSERWIFLMMGGFSFVWILSSNVFPTLKTLSLNKRPDFFYTLPLELCTVPQLELQEQGPKYLVSASQAFREKPILCNKRCRTCQTSELTLLIFSCLWTPYLTCYEVHNFARKNHITPEMCVNLQNASFHPSL